VQLWAVLSLEFVRVTKRRKGKNLKFTCFKNSSLRAIYYVKLKIDLNQCNLPHVIYLCILSLCIKCMKIFIKIAINYFLT
jgi:hypothetical protein